jgi:predicted amidophosphoribosyltransferase
MDEFLEYTPFFISIKGIVQELIHKLKYKGHEDIGAVLGNWYAADLKEMTILRTANADSGSLHKKKFRERGYNQVTTFDWRYRRTRHTVMILSLFRTTYSKTQSQKTDWTEAKESMLF